MFDGNQDGTLSQIVDQNNIATDLGYTSGMVSTFTVRTIETE
ncbi:MAG: hypothetical protein WD403_15185 [Pirellulales bacterium]